MPGRGGGGGSCAGKVTVYYNDSIVNNIHSHKNITLNTVLNQNYSIQLYWKTGV